jgi:U3 small nucleolar RNA-associated protein 18
LHIRRTPLHTSTFAAPSGNRIFASGRRRYFHIWDLDTGKVDKVNSASDRNEQKSMERFKVSPCGRYVGVIGSSRKGGGLINVLDSGTAQWIAQVRVDGRGGVADFAWWSDGEGLTVASKNGEVSEWDGKLRRVVARWVDAGAVGTTVLSLGGRSGRTQLGGDRWVAIGSSSGVVNIYDRRDWAAAYANAAEKDVQNGVPRNPVPARALDQLTTPISHLVFAPDGQMLAMASRWKRDALRLGMFLSFLSFPLGNRFLPFTNDFFFSPSPLLHRLQELAYIQHTPRPNFIRGYLA